MTSRKLLGATGLLIALVFLVSVNMISQQALKTARIDLTDGRLYTLSDGTRSVLGNLEEPVTLRLFFSEKDTNNIPSISTYGRRVREMLEEYNQIAGGKLKLEVIDPRPFTEQEDEAVAAGMQGVPLSPGTNVYFGLEGTNSTTGKETIPFFDEGRAKFLEYDITSLIHKLSVVKKPNLTIVSPLPIGGKPVDPMAAMMGRQEETGQWAIHQVLQQQFEVTVLHSDGATEVPPDTDVLMLVHPKGLSDKMLYAIDQYLVGGGNAMIFIDPKAEVEEPPSDPNNPMMAMFAPRNSNVPKILESLGLEMVESVVAGDRTRAQQVNVGQRNRPEIASYVLWLGLREDDINREQVASAQLEAINLATAGVLRKKDGASTEITPILQTTTDSQQIASAEVATFPDPKKLFSEFKPGDEKLMIAAMVRGTIKTSFPDGAPAAEEGAEEEAETPAPAQHLTEGTKPANVLVVADVDMLADQYWVQVQRLFGQSMVYPIASNGNMVLNFADLLSGSDELVGIRGRGMFDRPFTRIKDMEREASKKFAEKQKGLQDKLKETEDRINELQKARGDGDAAAQMFLTPEQEKELKDFREQQSATRKELRAVQANLNQDVEQIQARIKMMNIGGLPLLVGLVAVGMGVFRARRRRRI